MVEGITHKKNRQELKSELGGAASGFLNFKRELFLKNGIVRHLLQYADAILK